MQRILHLIKKIILPLDPDDAISIALTEKIFNYFKLQSPTDLFYY
jgi:hypothetical protein